MKRLLVCFGLSGAVLAAAGLSDVRKVYMLPMTNSLDQYLANRLTNEQVFDVVADPALADAVFTDRLGEAFELKLAEILPAPEPVKPAAPPPEEKDKKSAEVRGDPGPADTVNKLPRAGAGSSIGRSKGTVFLVDARSKLVVWSAFEPARDATAKQLDRTASALVSRIKRDLNPKKK
jgi:hypothetical protein